MVYKQAGPILLLSYIGPQTVETNGWLISNFNPVSLNVTNDT